MNAQASSQFQGHSDEDGAVPSPEMGESSAHGCLPGQETSQAERAAMHPEPHDLEWGYYFGAWSH